LGLRAIVSGRRRGKSKEGVRKNLNHFEEFAAEYREEKNSPRAKIFKGKSGFSSGEV